ncbi:leucine-, isoleucine-, valine-, threonine-, and alanine-binding protein (plasmid) [Antarctobacter heliothermus]|uniref:Leucine-, isoleucine-, valine-, threonine-, and alanine-binding protein n=1 Tax=Antarctobacter heliothermus TaxID=74033 RepID=A0A222EBE0_9RHOB|nr:ABC transporter substrate-binding protein [Antarctobacter heliothermus]ASP23514.1 leucine-, isoleucine-, valine-, threonine-, and alanine-binding protein [Antarctobacter heliothermus]
MMIKTRLKTGTAIVALTGILATAAQAEEIIKLGLSVPLSGAAAVWGKGAEFLCETAAEEIRESGGVSVDGETYNFECLPYDNKYNAAEGTKVAQALLNREGVKFIGGSLGTAPVQALQSLAERQGVLVFTVAWGASLKGMDHPMTFTQMNTPGEILPLLIGYIADKYPEAKSVAMLNPNDATGQETEALGGKVWQENGVKVASSDFYERGTTEFQPIAARLASLNPAIIDLGATPPADAGAIFKELDVIGWSGVKVVEVGTGADGLKATGGGAAEGVYMGAGVTFDGDNVTDHQKAINDRAKAEIGESLNAVQIGFYDSLYALKAAMEMAGSVDPKAVAEVLPEVTFQSFYGQEVGFYGEELYGRNQQMRLPIIVTQVTDGVLVEVARLTP